MRLYTIVAMLVLAQAAFGQAPNLPITFETGGLVYDWRDFEGGVASVVANPQKAGINTSDSVGQMIKFAGQVFGGSTLPLAGPVIWGDNNAIKMKVWANRVGAGVTFKFEGSVPVEVTEPTTVANEWEELTFSFSGLTFTDFSAITLIYDLGVVGDGSDNFTMFFDDIVLAQADGSGLTFPIDFESSTATYTFSDFAGGVASVIPNPVSGGANTSAVVGQMVKFPGEVFGGSTLALGGTIDFGQNNGMTMKVYANRVDAPILLKLEGPAPVEVTATTTVANEWETLEFSFDGFTNGVYTAITLIYDLGVVGDGSDNFTFFFDDISLAMVNSSGGLQLPIDFEGDPSTYNFSDFAGGVATVIPNPASGTGNSSGTVVQMVKFAGEVFGGSTLQLGRPLDFSSDSRISMKTFANRAGASVLFKLEGPAPVERFDTTTVANEWEELTFDFTGATSAVYTGITIIYELGVVGDGSADFTFLFDDIIYGVSSSVGDLRDLNVKFAPNPVQETLLLEAKDLIQQVALFNSNGQEVLRHIGFSNSSSIDVSALPAGSYFMKVQTAAGTGATTIVKQ